MKTKYCCICGNQILGFGNNPSPVKETGVCCGDCNAMVVVPARIKNMLNKEEGKKE